MDISHFFERPLLLKTIEWDDNNVLFDATNWWTEYFTHRAIWPKLLGYSRMTANLELEFRVNGSPFRFGDVLVSYRPLFHPNISTHLANFSGGYLPEDGCIGSDPSFPSIQPFSSDQSILARSQRQSVYLIVSESKGGKMVLPFIYPFESLRMTSLEHDPAVSADVTRMKNTTFYSSLLGLGVVTMESLSVLRNTQIATSVGVSIDVFVRAVNVHVWMASGVAAMKPQGSSGKGEESMKPSQVSSIIAAGLSAFSYVPVIGPLATAGSMVAEGVSNILKFFGFTPMPLNAVITPVVNALPFIQSSLYAPRSIESLSLDHQNQVSIDPTLIGGPSYDELSIASFTGRSCILFRTYFGSSCVPNDTIALIPVHPMLGISSFVSTGSSLPATRHQLTPCAFAAMNFRQWRGTLVLNFRTIKTKFHKGRLRITWDPELANSKADATTDFTAFYEGYQQMVTWDLDSTDNMEVKIGFASRSARLTVPPIAGMNLSTLASWKTNAEGASGPITNTTFISDNYLDYVNGFVRVSVLNRLQAPDTTYPVPIVVSASFENLELYDPLDQGLCANTLNGITYSSSANVNPTTSYYYSDGVLANFSTRRAWPDTFYPQGSEEKKKVIFEFQPTTSVSELVYEGEVLGSLRALAAREVYYDTLLYEVPSCCVQPTTTRTQNISTTIPPCVIDTLLPWRPSCSGTVGPMRSTIFTTNVTAPTYTYNSAGGTSSTYVPSFCRTPFSVLLQECFVGQRGSYNWKFLPGPSYGVEVKDLFVSRSNCVGDYTRVGSFPRKDVVSPYTSNISPDSVAQGFAFSGEKRTALVPLAYDTGTSDVGKTMLNPRNLRNNITLKLSAIRTLLGAMLPNFGAGAICADKGSRLVAGIRFPFNSMTKFLPGSSTGWMTPFGNSELASNIRLSVVTSDSTAPVTAGGVFSTDTNWALFTGLPSRPYVSIYMVSSVGDDWSVSNFVNVPTLYVNNYPDVSNPSQTDA